MIVAVGDRIDGQRISETPFRHDGRANVSGSQPFRKQNGVAVGLDLTEFHNSQKTN